MIQNQDFKQLIYKTLPETEANQLLESLSEPIKTSIRINRKKIDSHVD